MARDGESAQDVSTEPARTPRRSRRRGCRSGSCGWSGSGNFNREPIAASTRSGCAWLCGKRCREQARSYKRV